MSTAIWDSGDVLASLAATTCDRCNERGRCVQLMTHGDQINLCLGCFCGLAYAVGKAVGEAHRGT